MPRNNFSIEVKGLKELQRSLDRFSRETHRRFATTTFVSAPVHLDDEGYLDRQCPAPDCRNEFKVLHEDYTDVVRDEVAYCVLCRHAAEAHAFSTAAQRDYVGEVGVAHVTRELAASARVARLDFKPASRAVPLPPEAKQVLLQRTSCPGCGCRYATLGSSFFCHACGRHSAIEAFRGSMETIRRSVEYAQGIDLQGDRDAAADLRREMIEAALSRAVGAFEAYAAERYSYLAPAGPKPGKNAFQNLDRSNKLWRSAIGKDYTDILDASEYADLHLLIQRRHLSHRGGFVDQEYLDKTGDSAYRVGQRVVIPAESVLRLVAIFRKVVPQLARDLGTQTGTQTHDDGG